MCQRISGSELFLLKSQKSKPEPGGGRRQTQTSPEPSSRLEANDGAVDAGDSSAYLKAVGTDEARKLRRVLETSWHHLPQPPFRHPDIEILVEAEAALARLHAFKIGPSIPHVLAGQARPLFRRLFEFGEFLLNLGHRIVYVGEIGVGITTAACRQSGLVTNPAAPGDLKGMMLDTGGGRTTLCDVYVRAGDRFSLEVEPLPDEEVYQLVEEFCRSVMTKDGPDQATASGADFKLPEEVERAVRVMAKLPRPVRRKGVPQEPDPAAEFGGWTRASRLQGRGGVAPDTVAPHSQVHGF